MTENIKKHDVAIIGAGPGGYVCAIRCTQLGMNVALIEKHSSLGGTCLNVGCIPSKALLDSSHKYYEIKKELHVHGIHTSGTKLDLGQMMKRKEKIVEELTTGIDYLIKRNKIHLYQAQASFTKSPQDDIKIEVKDKDQKIQYIQAKFCIIATGSESRGLPQVPVDSKKIIFSEDALSLSEIPKKLGIVGAGVIGLELGSVWSRLGSEVTIIEALPSILTPMDKEMRDLALRILKKQGLNIRLKTKMKSVEIKGNSVIVQAETDNKETFSIEVDKLLIAIGRKPYTQVLHPEKIGVNVNEKGYIEVDPESLETSRKNVYAIGDVIEGPMLAHRAEEEGMMVAEKIAGKTYINVHYNAIPWIVYTWPEIAWVGLSEEALTKKGIPCKTGNYLFRSNGRAKALNSIEGQVKIIAHKESDNILGVFIIGPHASENIAESTIAMEFGASSEDIARSFHAHPTLSEVIREAALDVENRAIHI